MGGAACKLLLNSGGVQGTLRGIDNVFLTDASAVSADLMEEGEKLICGFHKDLQTYEKKLLAATGYKE